MNNNNQNPWYGIPLEYLSELALCPSIGLAGCSNTMENFNTYGCNSGKKTKEELYDDDDDGDPEGSSCRPKGERGSCASGLYCAEPSDWKLVMRGQGQCRKRGNK